jgi:hypothetical protein
LILITQQKDDRRDQPKCHNFKQQYGFFVQTT